MFWILGADELVYALRHLAPSPVTTFLATELDHVEWAGLHAYDLIFPLFVFIVGVAAVFSLSRSVAVHGRGPTMRRILVRAVVLFALGIVYNGGLQAPWPDVRLLGVLQRIALAYAAAGLLFVWTKPRTLLAVFIALLVGYWAVMTFVPVRDFSLYRPVLAERFGADPGGSEHGLPSPAYAARIRAAYDATTARVTGRYDPGLNVANHFDYEHVPGRMYDTFWDPEGVVSTVPAVATCLAGIFAGLVLQSQDSDRRKVLRLLVGAAVVLAVGYAWSVQFPLVKKLWTSSFVLVAAGWSGLLLAAFHYVVEVRGWRRWCTPFVWIGMNPITLYLASSLLSFHAIAERLVGGSVAGWLNGHVATGLGEVVVAVATLGLILAVARFLYVRRIFLKV